MGRGPFGSTLKPGGGGGPSVPTNYLAVQNQPVAFGLGAAALLLEANNSEGPAYWQLNGDAQTLQCLESGLYVVQTTGGVTISGTGSGLPINVARIFLSTNFADPNALATWSNFEQDIFVDQSQDTVGGVFFTLTTAPLEAAPGDTFQIFGGLYYPVGVTHDHLTGSGSIAFPVVVVGPGTDGDLGFSVGPMFQVAAGSYPDFPSLTAALLAAVGGGGLTNTLADWVTISNDGTAFTFTGTGPGGAGNPPRSWGSVVNDISNWHNAIGVAFGQVFAGGSAIVAGFAHAGDLVSSIVRIA